MEHLSKIFIRTEVNKSWGIYSLRELLDMNKGANIADWFMRKFLIHLDLKDSDRITEQHVQDMLKVIKTLGIPLHEKK